MLLRNNIGDSLTSQLSNFVSSTKQGYVTAWDADIEKNFGIVDTLLYSPGFSDHFIESGLYDTLIESFPHVMTFLDTKEKREQFFTIVAVLNSASDSNVPLYVRNKELFSEIIKNLAKTDRYEVLADILVQYCTQNPFKKDKRTTEIVADSLRVSIFIIILLIFNNMILIFY